VGLLEAPDLVLVDLPAPGATAVRDEDGGALFTALRNDARLRGVPVVILIEASEPPTENAAAGNVEWLARPVGERELMGRIAARIEIAELRNAAEGTRERMEAQLAAYVRAHRDIERARALLATVIDQMPAGVIVAEAPSGMTLMANERVRTILGHAALPTQSTADFAAYTAVHADGTPFRADEYALTRALAGGFVVDEEIRYRRADGSRLVLSVNAAPVFDAEGRIIAAVNAFADITERKRAEEMRLHVLVLERQARAEAEIANRAKDEFLAMLGHELRNPLAPIVTALEILRLRDPHTFAKERAVIERQVNHLVRLVDDLLDVARIRRGKVELRRERIELAEIVANAVEMTAAHVEEKRHRLTVQVPATGLMVDVDAVRMAQVVANLLDNAVKYTAPGGSIDLRAGLESERVVLRLRDDGIGLAADMLPRVFDFFVQEKQELNRPQGGLGLGLAIVRLLVELHGGSVELHSAGLGHGTEAVVALPLLGG
jgi:PAS domain S-box-containing protein